MSFSYDDIMEATRKMEGKTFLEPNIEESNNALLVNILSIIIILGIIVAFAFNIVLKTGIIGS